MRIIYTKLLKNSQNTRKDARIKWVWIGGVAFIITIVFMIVQFNPLTNVVFGRINQSVGEILTGGAVQIQNEKEKFEPKIIVPYDLEVEKNSQKSVDEGHSPWRLDPAFVAQVFVGLKISPEGIVGEYPIKYEEIKIIKKTDSEAIAKINSSKSPVSRVYMKRLVRQDPSGIWTIVGYDPA